MWHCRKCLYRVLTKAVLSSQRWHFHGLWSLWSWCIWSTKPRKPRHCLEHNLQMLNFLLFSDIFCLVKSLIFLPFPVCGILDFGLPLFLLKYSFSRSLFLNNVFRYQEIFDTKISGHWRFPNFRPCGELHNVVIIGRLLKLISYPKNKIGSSWDPIWTHQVLHGANFILGCPVYWKTIPNYANIFNSSINWCRNVLIFCTFFTSSLSIINILMIQHWNFIIALDCLPLASHIIFLVQFILF